VTTGCQTVREALNRLEVPEAKQSPLLYSRPMPSSACSVKLECACASRFRGDGEAPANEMLDASPPACLRVTWTHAF
jgi:hypothetical protein